MKLKFTKKQRGIVFFSVFSVLVVVMAYVFVVPRVQLNITTVYHQSFSGTSVQTKVENKGTYDVQNLEINLSVIKKESGELVDYKNDTIELFEPRNSFKIGFTFEGPQIKTYLIKLSLIFESEGLDYNESFEYEIKEYMNRNWEEKVTDWRV